MLLPESEFGFNDVLVNAGEEATVQYGDSYGLHLNGEDPGELSDGGVWDDQQSVSSGPIPSTPDGVLSAPNQLDYSQRSTGYEQFLQVFQGEGDLPAELADDDMEYQVDPESYAAVPDEWYNLAGRISRTEVEELLRDGDSAEASRRANATDSNLPSASAPPAVYEEPLVQLSNSQRYLLHQQSLQMVQLQVQLYLLSRHLEGQNHVTDDLWAAHNRFVALSTSASTSYKPPQPQSLPPPTLSPPQAASNTSQNLAVFSVTMPAPGTSALLLPPSSSTNSHPSSENSIQMGSNNTSQDMADSTDDTSPASSSNHNPEMNPSAHSGTGNKTRSRRSDNARNLRPFLASVLALPTVVLLNQESLARLHATPGKLSNNELNRYIGLYQGLFRPGLLPKMDSRATMSALTSTSVNSAHGMMSTGTSLRNRWSSVEDDLLAIGFNLFHKNWPLIRQRLLPCKHVTAIATRFKNKTSKKSKDNPIKSIHAYNTRPLTADERDLLTVGVSQCGHNFEEIAAKFLPSRKSQFLAKTWRQMTAAKPKKLTSHRLAVASTTHAHTTSSTTPYAVVTTTSTTLSSTAVSSHPASPVRGKSPRIHHTNSGTSAASHSASSEPHATKNETDAGSDSESDDDASNTREQRRERRRAAAQAAQAADDYEEEDQQSNSAYGSIYGGNAEAGSLADRNRALQHYDQITRSRSSSVASSSDSEDPMQWDSEESSDLNIIESARGSSASDSGSESDPLMKYSRPSKRYMYHELSDSEAPQASLTAEARIRHSGASSSDHDDRSSRYPEDYHLRKFHASKYLPMLLDWEVVWQEEAVEAAMAAAETARLERLSGKVKPVGSSKKSRSKGSRHSKSKGDKDAIATVVSAANAEWDHELWLTPPPSPDPSTLPPPPATVSEASNMTIHAQMQDIPSSSSAHPPNMSHLAYPSEGPSSYIPMQHQVPMPGYPTEMNPNMMISEVPADASFAVRMPAPYNEYGSATPSLPPGHFRVPMSSQMPPTLPMHQQALPQQSLPQGNYYPMPLHADHTAALHGHPSVRGGNFTDPEIIMMQRSLEKEVRNSQMQRTGAKTTASYRSSAAPAPPTALPPGLFSVLTPEGQLITTPMNQANSLDDPKY